MQARKRLSSQVEPGGGGGSFSVSDESPLKRSMTQDSDAASGVGLVKGGSFVVPGSPVEEMSPSYGCHMSPGAGHEFTPGASTLHEDQHFRWAAQGEQQQEQQQFSEDHDFFLDSPGQSNEPPPMVSPCEDEAAAQSGDFGGSDPQLPSMDLNAPPRPSLRERELEMELFRETQQRVQLEDLLQQQADTYRRKEASLRGEIERLRLFIDGLRNPDPPPSPSPDTMPIPVAAVVGVEDLGCDQPVVCRKRPTTPVVLRIDDALEWAQVEEDSPVLAFPSGDSTKREACEKKIRSAPHNAVLTAVTSTVHKIGTGGEELTPVHVPGAVVRVSCHSPDLCVKRSGYMVKWKHRAGKPCHLKVSFTFPLWDSATMQEGQNGDGYFLRHMVEVCGGVKIFWVGPFTLKPRKR